MTGRVDGDISVATIAYGEGAGELGSKRAGDVMPLAERGKLVWPRLSTRPVGKPG
ncbi:MAG: hypothetical protein WBA99_07440 [Nodosilinea sp.]